MAGKPGQNDKIAKENEFDDFLAKYTPAAMQFIQANPDNLLAKILSLLAGFFYEDGKAEFPPVEESDKKLIENSQRLLDHRYAAKAYFDALADPKNEGKAADKITARYAGSNQDIVLTLVKQLDHAESGFKGAIYQDASGHTITFYGGIDTPDEDRQTIVQAGLRHTVNQQTEPAQQLLIEAARIAASHNPPATTECVGYSLGAMLCNDMSARLKVKSTNLADIGLPVVNNTDGKTMYSDEHFKNINENVVTLKITNDPYFGAAGAVYGRQVDLGFVSQQQVLAAIKKNGLQDEFNSQNIIGAHRPEAFVLASEKLQDQPPVTPAPASQQFRLQG